MLLNKEIMGSQTLSPLGFIVQPLYVVTAISNPRRFRSRYELYRKFEKYIKDSGAILYTIELAFGDRDFEVTQTDNPHHVQVRGYQEFWNKENLLRILISHLPSNWDKVAWIDADVTFARQDWVNETCALLDHHPVIQMFSYAQDFGPSYEPMKLHNGYVFSRKKLKVVVDNPTFYSSVGHPGYAWAITRDAYDCLGGFIDYSILGSGDRQMADGLFGDIESSFYPNMVENYKNLLLQWQERARKYIKGNVGYLDTTLFHYWHGKKKDRGYETRTQILERNNFDPIFDLHKDSQGLFIVNEDKHRLRDDLMDYFTSRNEDSIDT